MLFDSIKLVEGSEVSNLVVDKGPVFPTEATEGELFYNDGSGMFAEALYIYNGSTWIRQLDENASIGDMLPDTVAAGEYTKVEVGTNGIVVAGSNPTTLAGYGITDAQSLDADLTAIANISDVSGYLKKTSTNTWVLDDSGFLTGNQTITLSGDVTGSGTTSITAVIASTGVAAGSYGTGSNVATININSQGRIFNAVNTPIAIDASAVTTGAFINARISQSSVTQHQSSLSINENQVVDGAILARVSSNETISGSWSFNNPVGGVSPSADSHLATKYYVDQIAAGINPHASVRVATTENIVLSGIQVVDGITLTAGNRVLVKNQTSGSENGVYVAAAGAWARATDFDGSPVNEVSTGDSVFVETGTVNNNTSWIIVTQGTITVGTSDIQFSLFSRAGELTAGNGLTKTGNTIDLNTASSSRIVVNADNIDLATTGITPGTYTSLTVDAYGRSILGSNTQNWSTITNTPTTLAGYGITDAQSLDADLAAIGALSGTSGLLRKTAANTWSLDTNTYLTSITSGQITTALGYVPFDNAAFTNSAVTGKLLTGFVSGAGTITAADSILTAIQKLNGNIGAASGATNLTSTANGTTYTIVSDTGTDAVITAATTTLAGVMTAADKVKLDGISAGAGAGTVTSVSVATANGFAGTVANNTTTPSITLTTSVNGLVKGNGTSLSAAVAGTDYATPSAVPAINPTTPKDGDIKVAAGPIISIYAASAWRQIFPATYN